MILAELAADCCGCGACMTACPQKAITMALRSDGAPYPQIDPRRCIGCGLCRNVCAYGKPVPAQPGQQAYAAAGRDDDRVRRSTSGGVFASLAAGCLADGGMIAGAVLDCAADGVRVYHLLSDSEAGLGRMQGSKYVQSEAWHCFRDVQEALRAGKTVLFSGTPCQAAALKALTHDPDNLITIDLICHGTPPQKLLQDYAAILNRRFRGRLTGFCFRDKSVPKSFCARLELDKKGRKQTLFLRSRFLSYYDWFLKGALYRESCYSCPYASLARVSDLTMGDYWGIEQAHAADFAAGIMPRRGDWSCLLVNTEKGRRFLEAHRDGLLLFPSQPEWVAAANRQLNAPSPRPAERDGLLEQYRRGGYGALERTFIQASGGPLRYLWHLTKNLRENQALRKK